MGNEVTKEATPEQTAKFFNSEVYVFPMFILMSNYLGTTLADVLILKSSKLSLLNLNITLPTR
jgi:hypothetical protein